MKRALALLLVLCVCLVCLPGGALELQDCHRVKLTRHDEKQVNGSVVRQWQVQTALPEVDEELRELRQAYVDELAPSLKPAKNTTSQNSRLDVETRYSRTGLSWLSFVVQARVTYHRELIEQQLTTRTYDMERGTRVYLVDIFEDENEEAWAMVEREVRAQLTAYFPDTEPDQAALDELCTHEALTYADFSLHGMSLVLHYPAQALYPGKHTLMDVVLYYPAIRGYMTEEARAQTDNTAYYKTCALTFDDGPSRTNTTVLLNNLMSEGSLATFFVLGNRIEEYVDIVQKEHDNGHAVASHNWNHVDIRKTSTANIRSMRDKVDRQMIAAFGLPAPYDRVPYGLYPQMIKAKVGWAYIQWSVDTYDWRDRSTKAVLATVKKEIHDGAIILCHDIKDNTPESAKQICRWLAENGYIMLTVDELFAKDGVTLEPNTVYYRCENGDTSIKKR